MTASLVNDKEKQVWIERRENISRKDEAFGQRFERLSEEKIVQGLYDLVRDKMVADQLPDAASLFSGNRVAVARLELAMRAAGVLKETERLDKDNFVDKFADLVNKLDAKSPDVPNYRAMDKFNEALLIASGLSADGTVNSKAIKELSRPGEIDVSALISARQEAKTSRDSNRGDGGDREERTTTARRREGRGSSRTEEREETGGSLGGLMEAVEENADRIAQVVDGFKKHEKTIKQIGGFFGKLFKA